MHYNRTMKHSYDTKIVHSSAMYYQNLIIKDEK